MSHSAEIIAVGTELLLGNITNTNARDISRALSAVGVNVFWHTVVGDNPERLRAALDIARNRADIIITTGGLGPTYDDLTKQTVCAAFGKPLVLREDVLEGIRAYFARNVHLTMPENNRQQAEFPADCVIFDNPVGTAPGCAFEAEGTHVLMLPGPPFEMLTMLRDYAVPYLRSLSREVILSHDIMTFGMGESAIEELMREKIARMENPSLATYARPSEVRLRATAKAENAEAAEALLAPVVRETAAYLGDIVYGVDVPNLETACMAALKKKGWTFATAESCTGGTIAARFTAMPGASAYFKCGVVTYSLDAKQNFVNICCDTIARYGAVSEQVVRQMAEGVRHLANAHYAIATTGIAGPTGGTPEYPVGSVWIAVSSPLRTTARLIHAKGDRTQIIREAGTAAIELLEEELLAAQPGK